MKAAAGGGGKKYRTEMEVTLRKRPFGGERIILKGLLGKLVVRM
jgi:hypothetical protein